MIESVLSSLFTLENLLWINVGLAGGIMVGALPGLTGTMAMALLLPLTYGLASIPGVMLLLGVYCGSIYGGSITAILINTPGTPASAATSLDGYPMAQKGHGLRALHDALSASTIGGLFSCAVLLFAAPPIASFALKFGPAEYFALALFGLTIIASVGGKSQIKGLLMGFVGLLISCIGIDPMDGVSRFTFGINRMEGGIDTIPVLIGLFAITEIMAKARDMNKATGTAVKVEKEKTRFRDVLKYKMVLLKSSILGVFIGAVPGTGAAISSFLAYNEAKRTSKHPEEYGHGSEEAVVASESANNAVTGATLIPLLTLGIPGDTNTAVLLGALTMQGIAAGPQLFTQHGEWVYTIMLGLIAVNIFMYLQGRVFIRGFVNITRVPTSTLVPILVMLCVIGAYAIDYSVFNAIFMVGVGIFGYFMTKLDMPMTPMVIGLVLGKLCESNLRRALIVSKGSWATFFTSPSACSLFFCRCLCCSSPILRRSWRPAGLRLDQRRTYEKWEFDSALFRKILSRQRRPLSSGRGRRTAGAARAGGGGCRRVAQGGGTCAPQPGAKRCGYKDLALFRPLLPRQCSKCGPGRTGIRGGAGGGRGRRPRAGYG